MARIKYYQKIIAKYPQNLVVNKSVIRSILQKIIKLSKIIIILYQMRFTSVLTKI